MAWKTDAAVAMRADLENSEFMPIIKKVAENGNRIEREELEAETDPDVVEELIERNVLSTDRFGGKNWVEGQSNRRLWKKPQRA